MNGILLLEQSLNGLQFGLMLFLLATFLTIFWLSAVLGRAWCGWASTLA